MVYKIGEFSKLAKTTIKTLRYYEREGLLSPAFVDENLYRYYTSEQLVDLAKIVSLRQLGFSIDEIKSIHSGTDLDTMLSARKREVENQLDMYRSQLSKINYFLEVQDMKYVSIIAAITILLVKHMGSL